MGSVRFGSDTTSSVVEDMDVRFCMPSLSTETDFNFLSGTLYAVSGLQPLKKKRRFLLSFWSFSCFLLFRRIFTSVRYEDLEISSARQAESLVRS